MMAKPKTASSLAIVLAAGLAGQAGAGRENEDISRCFSCRKRQEKQVSCTPSGR
jgi:hypothetical protein